MHSYKNEKIRIVADTQSHPVSEKSSLYRYVKINWQKLEPPKTAGFLPIPSTDWNFIYFLAILTIIFMMLESKCQWTDALLITQLSFPTRKSSHPVIWPQNPKYHFAIQTKTVLQFRSQSTNPTSPLSESTPNCLLRASFRNSLSSYRTWHSHSSFRPRCLKRMSPNALTDLLNASYEWTIHNKIIWIDSR